MTDTTTAPLLVYVDGRPTAWLLAGTLRPFIAGGEGDEAGGAGAEGEGPGEGEGAGTEEEAEEGSESTAKKVEMTQAELDALIAKRAAKAVKAAQAEAETAAQRAKLDETDRLKAEKADAEAATKTAIEKANERIVTADAKVAAVEAGVKADRLAAFLRITDLAGIEVDDDGNVDAKALKKAVDATLKDFPEFKTTTTQGAGRAGGRHNGDQPEGRAANLEDAVSARLAG